MFGVTTKIPIFITLISWIQFVCGNNGQVNYLWIWDASNIQQITAVYKYTIIFVQLAYKIIFTKVQLNKITFSLPF